MRLVFLVQGLAILLLSKIGRYILWMKPRYSKQYYLSWEVSERLKLA